MSTDQRALAIEQFKTHVSPGKVEFFEQFGATLVMGKREGIWFEDLDGRRFINCHSNGGVFNLGHRNPKLIEALIEGVAECDVGNHHLISADRAKTAAALAATTGNRLPYVTFAAAGGEAIDLAIKIARGVTGRSKTISAKGGYHGHTGFAVSAGDLKYRRSFAPAPADFCQVPFGDLAALREALTGDTAAVIFETIPATVGILVPPPEYLAEVAALCKANGSLLILDEVQSGFGRTGTFWACEQDSVWPDLLVTGKGLGGGLYPMAAVLYTAQCQAFFAEDPFVHISTYGGAELGCRVSAEVIAQTRRPEFLAAVERKGRILREGLHSLVAQNPACSKLARGRGLMLGLVLQSMQFGPILSKLCMDRGVFVVYAGIDPSVVQILPPLIITEEEISLLLDRLGSALADLEQMARSLR